MNEREMWAARFRRFCQKVGLSQRVLAERADVSSASISYWQSGKTIPDVLDMAHLARGLNLPLATVLYELGMIEHGQPLYELLRARELAGLPLPWEVGAPSDRHSIGAGGAVGTPQDRATPEAAGGEGRLSVPYPARETVAA